jgi:DNA polymerase I
LIVQVSKFETEEDRWHYNCLDCAYTFEIAEVERKNIESLGLSAVDDFQQRFFWPVLECMQRGVRIDKKLRDRLANELGEEMFAREMWFTRVLGHPLNPKSPKQMSQLFYEDLRQKHNYSKPKPGAPRSLTCDDKALTKIAAEEPLLRPLIQKISEYRSLGVFLSTFVLAPLDVDGRMRTSYNICGTETFRFSSSENAFGSGTNLQNIPKGGDDGDGLELPNIRKIFIPDDGYIIFDTDLSKADLRIVVWESGEAEMKAMLREGRDPYVEVAREFYRDPSIRKTRDDGSENPKYRLFKSFCHGTHYLGTPHGLAQRLGLTVHEADRTQRWYLGKYPAIKRWQDDFKARVASRRFVENVFGYRRYYFDRPDDAMFREAIAWVPQSTVALYINRIWMNIYEQHKHIQILLQVHDSLVGQFPAHRKEESLKQLAECGEIVLPYEDPLVIPVGMKWSEKSWGDCE